MKNISSRLRFSLILKSQKTCILITSLCRNLKAKAISLSRFAVTTGNKITECPECKAFRQYTEEIKGSYQSRINLLEETLDYERRQSVEFKRMLFVQLGVLNKEAIQQVELETQVRI